MQICGAYRRLPWKIAFPSSLANCLAWAPRQKEPRKALSDYVCRKAHEKTQSRTRVSGVVYAKQRGNNKQRRILNPRVSVTGRFLALRNEFPGWASDKGFQTIVRCSRNVCFRLALKQIKIHPFLTHLFLAILSNATALEDTRESDMVSRLRLQSLL